MLPTPGQPPSGGPAFTEALPGWAHHGQICFPPTGGIPTCTVSLEKCTMDRPLNPCFEPPVRPPHLPPVPRRRLAARAPVQPGTRTGAPVSLYRGPLSWYIMGYPQEMSLFFTNNKRYCDITSMPAAASRSEVGRWSQTIPFQALSWYRGRSRHAEDPSYIGRQFQYP